ncbi:MAG: hypothetical protein K9I94_15665 [Bacteroidales bacterium]|nr:hypothetical protein [Bacteroidales bacterium]
MGVFNNFFGSKKLSKPVDFSQIGTDFHSHLVPAIDDGVQSMDEAVEMIRGMHDMGFKKLITTPHIQFEFYRNTPKIINDGFEQVKKAVKEAGIPIELEAAAEYLLDDGFEQRRKAGELMTFGDNYILVEMGFFAEHPNFKQFVFDLQIDGYKVILAHAERFSYWFNNFDKYKQLKDRGIFIQVNTVSLTGYYSQQTKKIAEKLIDEGMVDFLGSDLHNKTYLDTLNASRYEKYVEKLVNSGKLLNKQL